MIPKTTTVVALLGLPRSGTTLVARHIGAHSRIAPLIEPYQAQKQSDYKQTQLEQLCVDFNISVPSAGGILIKETATRPINIDLTLQTLRLAAEAGYPTGIILQLRSPIEALYSQVEAAQVYWRGGKPVLNAQGRLQGFWHKMEAFYNIIQSQIYRFPLRVCIFHRFLVNPRYELSRLMAFFPLELEATQFDIEVAEKKMHNRGQSTTDRLWPSYGDPKAWDKSKPVSLNSVADRTRQVAQFRTTFGEHPLGRRMLRLHNCVTNLQNAALFDDDEIAARFFLEFGELSDL